MKAVRADHLFTVSGMLAADECQRLIDRGEALGFERAAVRTSAGPRMRSDIRDNDRAEFTDPALAAELWGRCRPFVPERMEGGTAVGLGDHFRFYRYDPGQRFNRHKVGVVERSPAERTRLTCLFYLNDGFVGGETAFFADGPVDGVRPEVAAVVPRAGDALFFRHEWWHEGRAVTAGRKYVLRSDVFYRFPANVDSADRPA